MGDHKGRPYAPAQFYAVGGGAFDAPPVAGILLPSPSALRAATSPKGGGKFPSRTERHIGPSLQSLTVNPDHGLNLFVYPHSRLKKLGFSCSGLPVILSGA